MNRNIFVFAILLLLTDLCVASNWGFVNNAPYSRFNSQDHKLFDAALEQTLNEAKDGEKRTWSNPSTKSHGELTPLRALEIPNMTCREVQIANSAGGRSARGAYAFCKQKDGSWKIDPGKSKFKSPPKPQN